MKRFLFLAFLLALSQGCQKKDEGDQGSGAGGAAGQERVEVVLAVVSPAIEVRALSMAVRDVETLWERSWRFPNLLAWHYQEGEGPYFVAPEGLQPRGEAVIEVLRGISAHAIHPEEVGLEEIEALISGLEKTLEAPGSLALLPEEEEALREAGISAPSLEQLLAGESPLPSWRERYLAQARWRDARLEQLVELERALADAILALADELSLHNVSDVADERRRAVGDERLVRARRVAFLEEVCTAELTPLMARVEPSNIQYARLKEALVRYQAIEAAGGWPVIEVEDEEDLPLRKGRSDGPAVLALQQRLAAEEYYEGELHGRFTKELRAALKAYQETHQLKPDGEVEKAELDSLNRSVAMRIAQIEVTLDRWRDTRIGVDPYYIHVSLPDFHAEVWQEGALQHRFRVIVGNTSRYFSDERQDYVYINATPLISAQLENVIFNPYWNVPPRLVRELKEKAAGDPEYYEKHGYEVTERTSSTRIRQLPGPKNALGVVKFQFPNRHDVYMHDTPRRFMFKHEIRAFSHGCVRVDDPLKFAEVLLGNDGRSAPKSSVARYLEPGDEDWTELRTFVPVHLEYYTVRVDDEGWTHFNADVYRFDKPLVQERLARRGLVEIKEGEQG